MTRPSHISFPLKWDPMSPYLLDSDDRVVGEITGRFYPDDNPSGYDPKGWGRHGQGWMEREEYDEWVAFFRQRVTPGMSQAEVLEALNAE